MSQQPDQTYMKESERLFAEAQQALNSARLVEALQLSDSLVKRGFSGGWELKAQVQAKQGAKKAALLTLRELLGIHLDASPTDSEKVDAHVRHVRLIIKAELFETIPWLVEQEWALSSSEILAYAADECLKLGFKQKARKFALEAASLEYDDDSFFWYIRQADNLRSTDTVLRSLILSGRHLERAEYTRFEYHVASDTMAQALAYVGEMESSVSQLQVTEILSEEAREDLPWGVYWRSARVSS